MTDRRLRERMAGGRALVTGASGGIGRAIAVRLAQIGVPSVLVARNAERLRETIDAMRDAGGDGVAVAGDVTLPRDRRLAVAAARHAFGGLDLLVNNAGVSAHGRFLDGSPDRFGRILRVNLLAAAELTREAAPLLEADGGGCVACVGSILGWRGAPHNAEYSASKFALRGWCDAVRPELTRRGVHVLHASPGTVDTGFFDHLVEKRGDLPWGKRRGRSPESVAEAIVRGVARRRNEVAIGWDDWAFVRLTRLAPWVLDRVMSRYG
ncbi:MAG: SDR family NAD(P)-dependent oxidoreductase [Planctomycetota bacterium]